MAGEKRTLSEGAWVVACSNAAARSTAPAPAVAAVEFAGRECQGTPGDKED